MAFTYNIEKDLRFQEGEKRGEKRGEEKISQAIRNMFKIDMNIQTIAQVLEVSEEFVKSVLEKEDQL